MTSDPSQLTLVDSEPTSREHLIAPADVPEPHLTLPPRLLDVVGDYFDRQAMADARRQALAAVGVSFEPLPSSDPVDNAYAVEGEGV